MVKAYERITWKNEPSTDTPLNENNLNKMDLAIDVIDDRVCNMEDAVADKVTEAESYAKGGTGSRQGEDTDNAKYYMQMAQSAGASGVEAKSYAVGGTGSRAGENTDNAKYYKEQAKNYADQAQSVVGIGIATTSKAGIVKPDGTSVTVDINGTIHAATVSNPNLLDNPFFTVNQRQGKIAPQGVPFYYDEACTNKWGDEWVETVSVERIANGNYRHYFSNVSLYGYFKASDVVDGYVGSYSYSVDRWRLANGITVQTSPNGLIFSNTIDLYQIIDADLWNKTATASVKLSNGQIVSGTYTFLAEVPSENHFSVVANSGVTLVLGELVSGKFQFSIMGSTETIVAVKLELGSVSTLEKDSAPNYEIELIKCKTSKADATDTYANKVIATADMIPQIPANIVTTVEPEEGYVTEYPVGTTIDVIEE